MPLPPGRTIRLSPSWRFLCDMMRASQRVPLVAIERTIHIAPLLAARKAAAFDGQRPGWFALFLKAYALVSLRRPELRRCFLSFPYQRIHEHSCNVASVAIGRPHDPENPILILHIRHPERLSVAEIDRRIRRARDDTAAQSSDLRRQIRTGRMPWPLRGLMWWLGLDVSGYWRARFAGTFGFTGVAALGATSLHTLSPLGTTLTYGVIAPDDAAVVVRLFYDHRVLDGIGPASALRELEETLNGPVAQELGAGASVAA